MLLRKRFMDNVLKVQKSWSTRRKFLLLSAQQIADTAGIAKYKYLAAEKKGTDSISTMIAIEKAISHFESALSKDYKNAIRRANYEAVLKEKQRQLAESRVKDQEKLKAALAKAEEKAP